MVAGYVTVVDEVVRDLDRRKPWLAPEIVREAPPGVADRAMLRLALREWPDRIAPQPDHGSAGEDAMSPSDVPRQRDGEIQVVVPNAPPELTPRAARALLRLLRNVDARRKMGIVDQQASEAVDDRRAA